MNSVGRRTTLLYLVTEDWYFVSHRLPLAAAARDAGYRVVVGTRVQEDGAAIRGAGIELVPLGWRRSGNSPFDHWRAVRELVSLYRSVRPDLVHHVALKPVVFGSVAARWTGIQRRVNAIAGLGSTFSSGRLTARLIRPLMRSSLRRLLDSPQTRTIVQNHDDRDLLVKAGIVAPERLVVILGAGVDLDVFSGARPELSPPVVLFASRMLWDKGVGQFVEAARALRREGIQARFLLAGDPDPDNPGSVSREQLKAWHSEGAVEWLGYRQDMPRLLREAQVLCLPSNYGEGIPKVLIEAAASGLPIITTDAPGCREVVRHGENGFLVPPKDPTSLRESLLQLLRQPEERLRMGLRSRAIAEAEFSLHRVIAETLAVYRGLLG